MPSSVARKPKSKEYPDIEVLSEDDLSFVAKIFGDPEPFTFSKDVNGYLQLGAYSGEPGAFKEFMLSLLEVDVPDEADQEEIEQARWDTKRRFEELMKAQRGLTIQRLIKFSLNITEIAGNGQLT
jgi:hypothetical protein